MVLFLIRVLRYRKLLTGLPRVYNYIWWSIFIFCIIVSTSTPVPNSTKSCAVLHWYLNNEYNGLPRSRCLLRTRRMRWQPGRRPPICHQPKPVIRARRAHRSHGDGSTHSLGVEPADANPRKVGHWDPIWEWHCLHLLCDAAHCADWV